MYLLPVVILILASRANGQGYACRNGELDFHAREIGIANKSTIQLYNGETVASVEACAKECFTREFCRFAVFQFATKRCEYSYFAESCYNKNRQRTFQATPVEEFVAISCIECTGETVALTFSALPSSQHTTKTVPELFNPATTQETIVTSTILTTAPPVLATNAPVPQERRLDSLPSSNAKGSFECFEGIERRVLLGASFLTEKGMSLDECKCLCAKTWRSTNAEKQCRSMEYYSATKLCSINFEDRRNASFPLLAITVDQDPLGTYYDLTCRGAEAIKYLSKSCGNFEFDEKTANSRDLPPKTSELSKVDSCYSALPEHLIMSMAGGFLHGVSLDECKCTCAKDALSRDAFACKSLMYYAESGDCVMNKEDHRSRPEMFKRDETAFRLTYYGLECQNAELQIYIEKLQCNARNATSPAPSATTVSRR